MQLAVFNHLIRALPPKRKLCLILGKDGDISVCPIKAYWGADVTLHSFLTWHCMEVRCQLPGLATLPYQERNLITIEQ
jgi:hypothetical protein